MTQKYSVFSLQFNNTFFRELPTHFYTSMAPEGVSKSPSLIHANLDAAQLIGLNPAAFQDPDFVHYFSGNKPLEGTNPLAMVYSGHQFGMWAGQLGDGRALLLGEVEPRRPALKPEALSHPETWDIQLKGGGLTPYSRMGDGRAVLRSSIREYLCSEALHHLGIKTTRALCIIATNEPVRRETLEPGAILTRLSPSHIRFGHFEHFHHVKDKEKAAADIRRLADYTIQHHAPQHLNSDNSYEAWFLEIVSQTAQLIAQWQTVGFAHGVMNTDNMSALSLTIDYGPFGFVEQYNPDYICNHSDHSGRYAFKNQPAVAFWNLHAFAYALQPLFSFERAKELLKTFHPEYNKKYRTLMTAKLGFSQAQPQDMALVERFLDLLKTHQLDYTLSFRNLLHLTSPEAETAWLTQFNQGKNTESNTKTKTNAELWLVDYLKRRNQEPDTWQATLTQSNPQYILRNWVAETAIRAAEDHQDYTVISDILTMLQSPYDNQPQYAHFAAPAPESLKNLCISCSS